ncbi:DUF6879 family protein [Streptomyces sp. DH12]|uniref:DUF6879 family protein n=1 Tax=Streptomyces sp. DH12 TaxID=2857010 RepID=UPI001E53A454|nr:DUF6879 family protein [Streptomyces sp. DH12]
MQPSELSFADQLRAARWSAVHLEMRDHYSVSNEVDDFRAWQQTGRRDTSTDSAYWASWVQLVRDAAARGVSVRRARIISEPVTEYIRYEHAGTVVNLLAGEQVRWLPRRLASDIALPGNDFWLFDDRVVRWNHFTGDGASAGQEVSEDPAAAKLCAAAFEAVWARGVPHGQYEIR